MHFIFALLVPYELMSVYHTDEWITTDFFLLFQLNFEGLFQFLKVITNTPIVVMT